MLKFISNLFRKTDVTPIPLASHGGSHFNGGEAQPIVPTVEIAHLSLAAILSKFPADLRGCVQQLPDAAVTVTLPVPTILKQLPTCSVKMSLASLYRQAPAGIFKPGPPEEKRMVEVPLPEIFKRVRPELLKRRQDQRPCLMPEEGYNLFGDKENPHAVSLTLPEAPEPPPRAPVVDFGTEDTFKMAAPAPEADDAPVAAVAPLAPPADMAASLAPSPALKKAAPASATKPEPVKAEKPKPSAPKPEGPPLVLSISELADKWPELIQAEVGAMNGSTVTLPNGEVTAGLAKGRVVFKWGQLREWITPPPPGASGADVDTELALPLRVVAPAFLKLSKGGAEARKRADVGEEIPVLFHGADAPASAPAQPAPVPVAPPEPAAVAEPQPVEVPAESAPTPVSVPVPEAPVQTALPKTISELFGQPDKANWSPAEIVENVSKLPGVSGAVVAMQEGLLVAQRLPEHMNGEAFAAFLPQIFARLNQYAGEMKLGEVNALTIHSESLPCQMFRHGEVLFAALGKDGEPIPSDALTLCASYFKK